MYVRITRVSRVVLCFYFTLRDLRGMYRGHFGKGDLTSNELKAAALFAKQSANSNPISRRNFLKPSHRRDILSTSTHKSVLTLINTVTCSVAFFRSPGGRGLIKNNTNPLYRPLGLSPRRRLILSEKPGAYFETCTCERDLKVV